MDKSSPVLKVFDRVNAGGSRGIGNTSVLLGQFVFRKNQSRPNENPCGYKNLLTENLFLIDEFKLSYLD